MPFGEVLEAVGKLSLEEQETLLDVLHRRIIEHRREEDFGIEAVPWLCYKCDEPKAGSSSGILNQKIDGNRRLAVSRNSQATRHF
jgi:hypothetical protein